MSRLVHHRRLDDFHFIVLDAPESRNALSPEMVQAIDAAIATVRDDDAARAVVLRGANAMFSAGGNIGNFSQRLAEAGGDHDPIAARNRDFGAFLERFCDLEIPTVAVVEGAAIGGGLGLACSCDFVIVASGAKFALTETTLGILPAQIAPFLVDRLGRAKTLRLTLSGQRFDGRAALEIGVADAVAETKEEIDACLARVLSDIGRCGPHANRRFKRLMRDEAVRVQRSAWLDVAARCFSECMQDEGRDGIGAFREKRPASWVRQIVAAEISDVSALPIIRSEA
ncbi:MAG TPA: enoyl-CoA hydratase-related protein [Xanthobacteraceae bacterium]|nr:enoyl-CoA hydratase-related protein [Xanthobacteraceae bacterium]